jgi:hypothetical protein
MRTLAGPLASVHFTHLLQTAGDSLASSFSSQTGPLASGNVYATGVLDLMRQKGVPIDRVCLLDPKASAELAPSDGENFDWFLFGVSNFTYVFCPQLIDLKKLNKRAFSVSASL